MTPQLDIVPVSFCDPSNCAIVRDKDFHRQTCDASDIRVGQRLAPDLEQLPQREGARCRGRHMDLPRRIMHVNRVEAVCDPAGCRAEAQWNSLWFVVHENSQVRVEFQSLWWIHDAVEAPDRTSIGLRIRPSIRADVMPVGDVLNCG